MQNNKNIWVYGLIVTLALLLVPIFVFTSRAAAPTDSPWDNVPNRPTNTDHTFLLEGPFETGEEVTLACKECHDSAAHEVSQTAHWNWESEPVMVEGRDEPISTGKKNTLNNFCIGIQSNWTGCTSCHAGYGWEDASFDFDDTANVDCLVCHETSGTYVKGSAGNPVEGVDLLAVAQSVGSPTRQNCGSCHFRGGGGNAVKHGDWTKASTTPPKILTFIWGVLIFSVLTVTRPRTTRFKVVLSR